MSELIIMRQRMKAIETIKKVTHAMRLIAMSLHARLRTKRSYFEEYAKEIEQLFSKIRETRPEWMHSVLWPKLEESDNDLIIIIGSQKGLCGNFNAHLSAFFAHHTILKEPKEMHLIVVGKRLSDILKNFASTAVMEFKVFNQNNMSTIAQKITDHILHMQKPYHTVTIYYNFPKTFFSQKPIAVPLIPFSKALIGDEQITEPYRWEQEPTDVLELLTRQLIFSAINKALVQSLIAEQSARFIAMDSSTRNASNLLDTMKINYNKLRQSKITRELTDLMAGL